MTAASASKGDVLDFPPEIRRRYRVRQVRLAPGEYDVTIPLTRKRGFVYPSGSGWYGVWINTRYPRAKMTQLRQDFPRLVVQQIGEGEGTFRVTILNGFASGWARIGARGCLMKNANVGESAESCYTLAKRRCENRQKRRNGSARWFDTPGDEIEGSTRNLSRVLAADRVDGEQQRERPRCTGALCQVPALGRVFGAQRRARAASVGDCVQAIRITAPACAQSPDRLSSVDLPGHSNHGWAQ